MADTPIRVRLWNLLGVYGKIKNLVALALACYTAWKASGGVVASEWLTPVPWLQAGAWFFGTWASVLVLGGVGTWAYPRLKVKARPPVVELTAEGGAEQALAHVRCARGKADVRVDGRIVEVLGGSVNPAPQVFSCLMSRTGDPRNGKSVMTLEVTAWTHVRLVSLGTDHRQIWVTRGREIVGVSQAGLILELKLFVNGRASSTQRYRITRKTKSHMHGYDEWIAVEGLVS